MSAGYEFEAIPSILALEIRYLLGKYLVKSASTYVLNGY